MSNEIREWTQQLPVGELFDLDDIQRALPDISRNATKMSVGRLCRGDDPLITRVCRGVYTRRLVGGRYQARLPAKALRDLPWRFAGPGAGVTGPYVINMFCWSTQVSPRLWLAMVERPPQRPVFDVIFERRSNKKRLGLNRWEVSTLEAVRCFDEWAEISWGEALAQFDDYNRLGRYGDEMRGDLILDAAECERGLGPEFLPRVRSLVEVL